MLTLALAACQFGIDKPVHDPGPDKVGHDTADTGAPDTDADTDSDSDTDTVIDTEYADWACGPYAPHVYAGLPYPDVSATAVYDYADDELGTGTLDFDFLGATTIGGVDGWVVEETGSTVDTNAEAHSWVVTTFVICDTDGVSILGQESSFTRGSTTDTSTRLYDPPMLIVPARIGVGMYWTVATTITETWGDGTTREVVLDRTREVTEEVSTTVGAGTWDALHVVESDADGTVAAELWLAPGVGTIQSSTLSMTSFTRFD